MRQTLAHDETRESCGAGERRLAERLAQRWQALADSVVLERFSCHPGAFLGALRVWAAVNGVALLAALAGYPWWSCAASLVALVVILVEVGTYRQLVDPLFPRATGTNVVATFAPRSVVRQRLVVSAHLDAAFEFNVWRLFRTRSPAAMGVAFALGLAGHVGCLVHALATLWPGTTSWLAHGSLALFAVTFPFPAAMTWFFLGRRVVPGAMDDLAGIAVLDALAQRLGQGRGTASAQEHTEVVLLATSSEEAGLRGAKHHARTHAEEYRRIPTRGLFLDGLCDERQLATSLGERFTRARSCPELVSLAHQAADSRGFPLGRVEIQVGATDASAFIQAGIPSLCLVGMDVSTIVDNYHSRLDTLERVRPVVLTRALDLVADLVALMDRECRSAEAAPRSHFPPPRDADAAHCA